MKRFLIPAFFVIHAESESQAEMEAGMLQSAANANATGNDVLFLDEELPIREISINPDETELPHTYVQTIQ